MNPKRPKLHIALDLGTTTLAGQLLASSGDVLAMAQATNPQQAMGADILLRLQQASAGEGWQLQSLLIEGLRGLVAELLARAGTHAADVIAVAAAGNPGMSCLLCDLPVTSLLFPPHKPPCRDLGSIPVSEIDLGLLAPLQIFPLVSGFVGGDLVACLLALDDVAPATLLIDLGTNAELALWDGCRWWATSAAAGPAFEAGNITAGMVMGDGAVTDVSVTADDLLLSVSGGGEARGLCGSGLVALVAAARQGGLIDANGCILAAEEVETNLGRYLFERAGCRAIRFHRSAARELLLTQVDLRNFQLAKGAVRAGVEVLLERGGFKADNVAQVLVTGALGSALPVEVLKRVALLPKPMLDKTSFIANGVLAGLQVYLTSDDGRLRLDKLMTTLQPLPLSGTPAFERCFLSALEF
jgi:uncharacterized 2Fe-2S/4Fe-4S cluster protein (DUF4445 family)